MNDFICTTHADYGITVPAGEDELCNSCRNEMRRDIARETARQRAAQSWEVGGRLVSRPPEQRIISGR